METAIDPQKAFEQKVCSIFKFKNAYIMQRDRNREQMIIDDQTSQNDYLSGTIAYKTDTKDFLLVATKDSEVNHISEINFNMIKLMIEQYVSKDENGNPTNKVTFCTNLPVDIHSHTARELKKRFNFHIKSVGYSFCQKHNLEFTSMY